MRCGRGGTKRLCVRLPSAACDAISRIIYWQGDEGRGVNGMAVDFIKTFNNGLRSLNPGCFTVAEDSTSLEGCTTQVEEGGRFLAGGTGVGQLS